jgi:hypothetical protein
MEDVRIGCSGWSYRDWRGDFYPEGTPTSRWLEHYASVFDTVEVNATLYRLQAVETVRGWAEQVPDGSSLLDGVRLPRQGTAKNWSVPVSGAGRSR